MTRKPRSDSKLLTLPDEEQERIFNWLRTGSQLQARIKIEAELGIKVGNSTLTEFYQHHFEEKRRQKLIKATMAAKAIESEVDRDFSPEMAQLFSVMALEAGVDERKDDAEDYLKMARFVKADMMKAERFDLERSRYELQLRKYEDSVAAAKEELTKAKRDGGMTVEAIEAMEAQLNML